MRWGITSSNGTYRGKDRRVGRRTVRIGIERTIFDGRRCARRCRSFVFNSTVREMRKSSNSRIIFVKLVMGMPVPYQLEVSGQNSCVVPVR